MLGIGRIIKTSSYMSVVSMYGKKDGNLTIYEIPYFVLVQKCKGSN
jgi:hypothetical protein